MTEQFGTTEQITTLGEVPNRVDSTAKTYPALVGENLGHTTLKFSLPINQLLQMSQVANRHNIQNTVSLEKEYEAQRSLLVNHARKLAQYTLMGLVKSEIISQKRSGKKVCSQIYELQNNLGKPAYTSLQPMVTNIRACASGGGDIPAVDIGERHGHTTGIYNITLSNKHILWVVDGQHRMEGFRMVLDFLKHVLRTCKYPRQANMKLYMPDGYNNNTTISEEILSFWEAVYDWAMNRATVSVECHLGLNEHEEQQLFYDLNSKGKKVDTGLAFRFDHTDPINKAVKEVVIPILPFEPKLRDKNEWTKEDDGTLTRREVNKITQLLCIGKTNRLVSPKEISSKEDLIRTFWETIITIEHFGETGWKRKTIAAQSVTLKAVAFTIYKLVYGSKSLPREDAIKYTQKIFDAIRTNTFSFSYDNPIWASILLTNEERKEQFPGIEKYIWLNEENANLFGVVDNNTSFIRFANRHNDIMQVLSNVISWQLGLPST